MASFTDLLGIAKNIGFFEFYLPFVLTFAVFYGILQKIDIFKSRNINLIISLALAFFVIGYTPVGTTLAQFLSTFFTDISLTLFTLLGLGMVFVVLVAISGHELGDIKKLKFILPIALLLGVLLVLGAFISSGGLSIFPGINISGGGGFGLGLSDQDIVILIIVFLTILVIWWLTKPEEETLKHAVESGKVKSAS